MACTSTISVAAFAGALVLSGCGVVPGFYSESAEEDALVDDCVEFVQMAAFAGDVEPQRVWNGAGQDASVLRDHCEGLLETDPELLDDYAQRKRVFLREMSTTDTTPANVIDDVTSGPTCNPNYSGVCLPFDEDVDCLPGDADGPWFIEKTVIVQGDDEFELDDDDDGLGCEPNPGAPTGA